MHVGYVVAVDAMRCGRACIEPTTKAFLFPEAASLADRDIEGGRKGGRERTMTLGGIPSHAATGLARRLGERAAKREREEKNGARMAGARRKKKRKSDDR